MVGNTKSEKFSPSPRLRNILKDMGKDRIEKVILGDFTGKKINN